MNLLIDHTYPESMIFFDDSDGENYDQKPLEYIAMLRDDDVKGFYDEEVINYCKEKGIDYSKDYYPTYLEMLHKVIFEPIVKYANEHFVKENSLYLTDS